MKGDLINSVNSPQGHNVVGCPTEKERCHYDYSHLQSSNLCTAKRTHIWSSQLILWKWRERVFNVRDMYRITSLHNEEKWIAWNHKNLRQVNAKIVISSCYASKQKEIVSIFEKWFAFFIPFMSFTFFKLQFLLVFWKHF